MVPVVGVYRATMVLLNGKARSHGRINKSSTGSELEAITMASITTRPASDLDC